MNREFQHHDLFGYSEPDFCNWRRNRTQIDSDEDEDPAMKALVMESVDFMASSNSEAHHTDQYLLVQDQNEPVLRRSSTFYMTIITKQRDFERTKDDLRLVFEFGSQPKVAQGTRISVVIKSNKDLTDDVREWDALIEKQINNRLLIKIQIANNAPVGLWKCTIESRLSSNENRVRKTLCQKPIYILFNPYSQFDSTYYTGPTTDLSEYVQATTGKVFKGTHRSPSGRAWVYNQFETISLMATLYILDNKTTLKSRDRGDPVKVSRALSACVNSVDEGGLISGKWSAPYEAGVAPWDWNGSVEILQTFMKNGKKPVKFGQCWVFSAVLVTLCRALGLACRSVTNFVSAHDTDASLSVDRFFDMDGDELGPNDDPEVCVDSVWNFHVWNEIFMARHDLPRGYGGWQVIDATPQERSDNMYQCGPAPVEAVRRGEVGLAYDVPFVFAEVNADVCHFTRDARSPWGFSCTKRDPKHVGRLIVTKRVNWQDHRGLRDMEDITANYKFVEGTEEERLAIFNAVKEASPRSAQVFDMSHDIKNSDVNFDLVDLDRVLYGQPYQARIRVKNNSREKRTLRVLISSSSVHYTGVKAFAIKKATGDFVLQSNQSDSLVLTIEPRDYMSKLVDFCLLKLYAQIRVLETGQMWSEEDEFALDKPNLDIELSEEKWQVNSTNYVVASLRNPLDVHLTRCVVGMDPGPLGRAVRVRIGGSVGPGEVFRHRLGIRGYRRGKGSLVATFSADQMIDVNGACDICIE